MIVYEGPKGGPGMQEMLYPTSFLKGKGLGQGLRARHRRPLQRRHLAASASATSRPRPARAARSASSKRATASSIDIPARKIDVLIDAATLAKRRAAMVARGADAWRPNRDRSVSQALHAYALMTTSAARGAVRDLSQLKSR